MKTAIPNLVIALIASQAASAFVFLWDVVRDVATPGDLNWHLLPEALAVIALVIGIGFEIVVLINLLKRKASLERSVGMASAQLQTSPFSHFDSWKLTASERDVAALMIKGLSISEIATVRGCAADGTVKAHLNAIYRKSDARNRAEVLSHIMDALIDKPLLEKAQ